MKASKTKERKLRIAKKLFVRACNMAKLDAYKIELQARSELFEIYKAKIGNKSLRDLALK